MNPLDNLFTRSPGIDGFTVGHAGEWMHAICVLRTVEPKAPRHAPVIEQQTGGDDLR
jgi:hypothetical protein